MSDCQFRVGADGRNLAIYCGATSKEGSSYCPAHHARIWTREKSSIAGTTDLAYFPSRREAQPVAVAHDEDASE